MYYKGVDYENIDNDFEEAIRILNLHSLNCITALDEAKDVFVVREKNRIYVQSKEHDVDLMILDKAGESQYSMYIRDNISQIKVGVSQTFIDTEIQKRDFFLQYKDRTIYVEYLNDDEKNEIVKVIYNLKPEGIATVCINEELESKTLSELREYSELDNLSDDIKMFLDKEINQEDEDLDLEDDNLDLEEEELLLQERLKNYSIILNNEQIEGIDKILLVQSFLKDIEYTFDSMLEDVLCMNSQLASEIECYLEKFKYNNEIEV